MKRSRLGICVEILKIIMTGCRKPTRIMYGTNISWVPLSKILKFLVDNHAITIKQTTRNRKEYYITKKGRNILRYHEHFMTMLTEETGPLPA